MPGADPPVRRAVLDASVAVRWVVPERGSGEAIALLVQPITWLSPRLMVSEVAATLRRKTRSGELSPETAFQALEIILDAVHDGIVRLAEDETAVRLALTLALALGHKLPDCLYLALAEKEGAALATADRRLAALAARRGIAVLNIPSA
ncbi:MAG: type II toxin-antitoxin system VapC family toxin [Acidobacteria bacterium]|nr:type II toxin-antitoxin system VapC family toxin [Acidobacteriota bacterium]